MNYKKNDDEEIEGDDEEEIEEEEIEKDNNNNRFINKKEKIKIKKPEGRKTRGKEIKEENISEEKHLSLSEKNCAIPMSSISGISEHLLNYINKRMNFILSRSKIPIINIEEYILYKK